MNRRGVSLSVGLILFIGLCGIAVSLIGGYSALAAKSQNLAKEELRLKDLNVILTKKDAEIMAKQTALDQRQKEIDASLPRKSGSETENGLGYCYVGTYENGIWADSTLALKAEDPKTIIGERSVTNSVYVRNKLPVGPKWTLGEGVGVARRGQIVNIRQITETKPGIWYAKIDRIDGLPSGTRDLSYGFK